mgnify:CR=1 FL=1
MPCNIYKEVKNVGFTSKDIVSVVKTMMEFLKKKNSEVSVHLVGDKKIKKINKKYRGINKVTDVLAFAMQDQASLRYARQGISSNLGQEKIKNNDLGDIFISIPQIKRQAKEQKILYKEELVRILAHGILHLNGFDHLDKKEEKKMFNLQEKMVTKIIKT